MDTKQDATDSPGPLFHPLTGWETASRWHAVAVEWMTRGLQQWVALMTAAMPGSAASTPAATVAPAQAGARKSARSAKALDSPERNVHAAASSGKPKRPSRAKPATRKSRPRS